MVIALGCAVLACVPATRDRGGDDPGAGGESGASGGAGLTAGAGGESGGAAGQGEGGVGGAAGASDTGGTVGAGGSAAGSGGAPSGGTAGSGTGGLTSGTGGGAGIPAGPPGLVAHWTFDDAFGASSAVDSAGLPDTATLFNPNAQSGFGAGKLGGGFQFKGDSEASHPRFRVEASADLNAILEGVTIAAWVFRIAGTRGGGNDQILVRDAGGGNAYYGLGTKSKHALAWFGESLSWGAEVGGNVVKQDVWTHVAGTYDKRSRTVTLYIDGVEVARNTNFIPVVLLAANATPLHIGSNLSDADNWDMDGTIDDLRLYNRALSAAEIAQIHRGN